MAVLGVGGKLVLKRSAPEACLVNVESVIPTINSLNSVCSGYWNGDRVSTLCLPIASDPFPPSPSGYATYYGGSWFLGPNRDHITTRTDSFYKTNAEQYPDGQSGDSAKFYCEEGDVAGGATITNCRERSYWIHIDELGRVSFYDNRCDALAGPLSTRIQLATSVSNSPITVAPYGGFEYFNAVWECVDTYGDYNFSDAQDSVTLVSICEDAPTYQLPIASNADYNNADLLPRGQEGTPEPYWQLIADIREWSLELSATSVDTTSVAEKFGTAVKSLVTAGGSTEFLIDRKCYADTADNGLVLMQLLMMTEKGCSASAQFWVMPTSDGTSADAYRINGGLYYETDILVTNMAVNLRPTEVVAGTASFVSTGEIKLLVSA